MAILAFQKPEAVVMVEANSRYGKFEFKPLEPGYGKTVGNALRRVLLSSLEGYAITSIKIDGVRSEFDSVPGVKEDVTNMILNIKQVDLKQTVEDTEYEKVTLTVSGQEVFTAGDISKSLSGFEVMNPELVICHLDPSASFTITLTINKGRSWVPAEENVTPTDDIDTIAIDSIHTPIKNVKYTIENYRVDQKTDYDKLILEITTNGTILPKDAIKEAAKILIYHFMLFSDEKSHWRPQNPIPVRNSTRKCCTCASSSRASSPKCSSPCARSIALRAPKWRLWPNWWCSTRTTC